VFDNYFQFQVVSSWERVTNLIQKREQLLHDLENFELEASNPHRFFYKGIWVFSFGIQNLSASYVY